MVKKKPHNTEEEPLKKVYPGMITLQVPPSYKSYYERDGVFNLSSINKDEVINLIRPLAAMLRKETLLISPLSAKEMKALVTLVKDTAALPKMLKDDFIKLYNSFAIDITNIPAVAAFDDKYKQAWQTLLTSYDIDSEDFEDILGRPMVYKRSYGWGHNYLAEALFFPVDVTAYACGRSYYDTYYEYRFSVAQKFRKILTQYLFGEEILKPQLVPQLPDDENLKTEDFESWVATDLVTLSGMALNGSMLTANGAIAATSLKKLKKQTDFKEFTPLLDEWPLDRVELVALTYFIMLEAKADSNRRSKSKEKEVEGTSSSASTISVKELALFAVEEMPNFIGSTRFNSFLPALQGFTKTWAAGSYIREITSIVGEILKSGRDAWQSLSNLRVRILCAPAEGRGPILKLFASSDRSKSRLQRRSEKDLYDSKKIAAIDWFEEVGFRFILNWIKYLCALGIVEIAMEKGLKSADTDSLAGMRYVRLTPLGLYAFGLAKDYVPKTVEVDNGVEFDGDNGIITLPSATSPYTLFLSTVARKISPVRFAISVESLIKGCRNKTDLDNRVASLRSVMDIDAEPGLKRMVEEALGRTDCMEREGGYSLLRIRRHLPEITRLIATDKTLRQIALPASRGMILVKTANLDKFYTACAAAGYLAE